MTYRDNAQTLEEIASDLSDLQDFYRDIEDKVHTVERLRQQYHQPFELSRFLRMMYPGDPGLCRTCGLPKIEDIDHDPPECPNPKNGKAEEFQPYFKHQQGLYTTALEALSTERLVGIGIPTSRFFSYTLRDIVEKRLDDAEARHAALQAQIRASAPTRWDIINGDE